jgi:alanine racemase
MVSSAEGPSATQAGARSSAQLLIDLSAIAANYALLKEKSAPATCAAVVKADAYGLGLAPVVRTLAAEGCTHFFIAHPGEGAALRAIPDPRLNAAHVYSLGGLCGEAPELLVRHNLTPVLSTLDEAGAWSRESARAGRALPAVLHIDTGMNRLGLSSADARELARNPLPGLDIKLIMSHLACAEDQATPKNEEQRSRFDAARALFPKAGASLANSSAIFLGASYLYDLTRPGCALYGVNPTPAKPNPMQGAVTLSAPILQVRSIDRGETVGYGATFRAGGPMRIATIGVGYADGYPRALGGQGEAVLAGQRIPVVGRVSMDLTTLDVTALPEDIAKPGALVELIGPDMPVDEVARAAGTIGYEILTQLGHRYARFYTGQAEDLDE